MSTLPISEKILKEERARFAKVVAARKTTKELVGLFEKLTESDKFLASSKPYCFVDLIAACAARVPVAELGKVLWAIEDEWVGDMLHNVLGQEADAAFQPLVRKVLEPITDVKVFSERMLTLRFSAVVTDEEHAFALARKAGLPQAAYERLKALQAYLAANPLPPQECPF